MQGSRRNSLISMRNSRRDFDDSNWGYDRKNTRGAKAKGTKVANVKSSQKSARKREYFYDE